MTIDRQERIEQIFEEALDRLPEERASYLTDACGEDSRLLAEVESLLSHLQEATDDFLEPSGPAIATRKSAITSDPAPEIGDRIGRYVIEKIIGSGGMGTVYLAKQDHPHRSVALKVMHTSLSSRSALRRFEDESEILARLRHSNIAQIFESGTHDSGGPTGSTVPYFALEYIPNAKSITDHADQEDLATRERLELFVQACEAIHHGHQRGIIHRDLKPANILVDDLGQVKIIDFGVARSTDANLKITTMRTDVGQLIGTVQYMSPEQCEADPDDLDLRSDVYSLGVVLYELLVCQLPYDVSGTNIFQATRIVREETPLRPSIVNPKLRGDVETILLKALEKDRAQRYQSVAEFSEDLCRCLRHKPISARPPSTWYCVSKFTRRNKAVVGIAAAAMSIVVIGGIFFRNMRSIEARRHSYAESIAAAHIALTTNDSATARQSLAAAPLEFCDWEWEFLHSQQDNSIGVTPLLGGSFVVDRMAISSDGTRLVAGLSDGSMRSWDAPSGERLSRKGGQGEGVVALSSDGQWVASALPDGTLRVWNADTGRELGVLDGRAELGSLVELSLDGTRLAWGFDDGRVRICDIVSGEELFDRRAHEDRITALTFNSDASCLASASADKTVRLWDIDNGKELPRLEGYDSNGVDVQCMAFSPFETTLTSGAADGAVRVWDTSSQRLLTAGKSGSAVTSIAYNPDGEVVALGLSDASVRVWNMSTGVEIAVLRGCKSAVRCVAFVENDNKDYKVSAATALSVRTWDTSSLRKMSILSGHKGGVRTVAFSPDGAHVASGSADGTVRIWEASTGDMLRSLEEHTDQVVAVTYSLNGDRLASSSEDTTVIIWNAYTGEREHILEGHTKVVTSVAFSPNGTHLASGAEDGNVFIWDVSTAERLFHIKPEGEVKCLAFSPDGTYLVSGTRQGAVQLWSASTGDELPRLQDYRSQNASIQCLSLSFDGIYLTAGGGGGPTRIWNISKREVVLELPQWRGVSSVAFTKSGNRIASGKSDGRIDLWGTMRLDKFLVLSGHADAVTSLAFSPDGTRLASSSHDGTIRIWDTVSFRDRYRERQAILDAEPEATRIVDELWRKLDDWKSVARRLRADTSHDAAVRHAALNLVLLRAANHVAS